MSGATSQTKRPKPDDSPDKLSCLLDKSTDVCGHCNKKCTTEDEAI